MMKRILKQSTGVRFAPGDTAGQRQGLIKEMKGDDEQSKEFVDAVELNARDDSILGMSIHDMAGITNVPESELAMEIAIADKHHMAVVASEFSQFVGQNNSQMLDFLTQMWDGDDYEYSTKAGRTELKNPLLNILGCTTPSSIASSMPAAVVGQGFLSRMILVYGARKYKEVARPVAPSLELVDSVKDTLNGIYYERNGAFDETPEAREYSISLYGFPLEMSDSRFGYYAERRYTHLIKVAMCLCASRGVQTIEIGDYEQAHKILRATERGMPDALGEFGMNPLAAVKQSVLEYVRSVTNIPLPVLQAGFHRECRPSELTEVINDLMRVGQVKSIQGKDGIMMIHAVITREDTEDAMLKLLTE
jgi:hypothetical protein